MAPWEPGYVPPIRKEATKRILVYLTPELHMAFKAAVEDEGRNMQGVILAAIERYTAAAEKRIEAKKRSATAKPRKR